VEADMDIAVKIKTLLLRKGMTQTDLAEKMGMSKNYFNNKLRAGKFTIEEKEKIAAFLGAKYNHEPPQPPREWFTLNDTGEEI